MTEKKLLPIGDTIKEIRKDKHLTLGVLAEKSGVSKAMLSQIESDKVNPTIATLWKISTGLGVDINELTRVISVTKRNFTLTKKDDITVLDCDEEGVHLKTLTPVDMIEDLEMYLITFKPGSILKSEPHFPGTVEFLTLLDGEITVKAGDNITNMHKDDFLTYHSDIEHSIENSGSIDAHVHMVVRYRKKNVKTLSMIYFLDIFGTLIFAVSGAVKAVKYELDIFGVTILAIATGIGGGMIRDILIGSVPPAALKHEEYFIICIFGALSVFFLSKKIAERWDIILMLDAVGLGVFTVIGAAKGMGAGLGLIGIIITGTMTATGGGIIRDLLANEIPTILKKDFYATAALIGGLVFIILSKTGMNTTLVFFLTFLTTTGIRLLAMKFNIKLPAVKSLKASPSELSMQRKKGNRIDN